MLLVRFATPSSPVASVGVLDGDTVTTLDGVESLGSLWRLPVASLRPVVEGAGGPAFPAADVTMLPPVDAGTEVWACGVTYKVSEEARVEESERAASVYEQVYDAERPELFFKSVAWRVVGHGEPVAVRADSRIDVPEPEVAVVVTAQGEIAGFTVCNDVSSRTIEGENPLYLPQAKAYLGACAVGPGIRPVWEVGDPYALPVSMSIVRDGAEDWSGSASTGQLRRRFDELVSFLVRADVFPDGAVLSTGTCLVPAAPWTLRAGDFVRIEVGGVGVLANPVVEGVEAMSWLVDARDDVRLRAAP
ncbi:fumarylacetoacetate hydrolase family protein [Jiangella alkaliphila]|uniref:2-dehydro-3-deoxy-D-arabinonate dehydratase n=1 Tax=Jiangella alkaliphila TaxID=419479 RepID=A0A1H2GVL1_9ACTN|nr:fumarylacetoacetate hydrolase family protein [Jiangella alkaliphila]SDU23551.1 2-dehydro-3-deoxy-D-arabinonate dehydratase [Jiangella alkaliphila]